MPTMRAQLWLLQLLLLRGVARALSPATPAGRARGQGRCRLTSRARGIVRGRPGNRETGTLLSLCAHRGCASVGRTWRNPAGGPLKSHRDRVHSREAVAFPCSFLLPPSAALGWVPVGLEDSVGAAGGWGHPSPVFLSGQQRGRLTCFPYLLRTGGKAGAPGKSSLLFLNLPESRVSSCMVLLGSQLPCLRRGWRWGLEGGKWGRSFHSAHSSFP